MQLITYPNRLGRDLPELNTVLNDELMGLFDAVHLLPFFQSIDGADAGFDPEDHTQVDARVGAWSDVETLAATHRVMADVIVNHVSVDSDAFKDVVSRGSTSPHWPLFMRQDSIFPEHASPAELDSIYRPRPGAPFTCITLADGREIPFWTTFSADQIDIDVESPAGRAYLSSVLAQFAKAGIKEVRLDAVGYAIKRRGTSCFMLPETFEFIRQLSSEAAQIGMSVLVETHSHYETQMDIAAHVDLVYDFALPPLILHALFNADARPCKRWLKMAPRNCITVLDTHDGIGIIDAAADGERPGLLNPEQITSLVERIHANTNGDSRRASGYAADNLDVYQVNSTYYAALGSNDLDFLLARAIQFFCPGEPQIYYVGLLCGHNDNDLVAATGVGRDINRHYYSRRELRQELARPVVQRLLELIQVRQSSRAFAGTFSMPASEGHCLHLRWDAASERAELLVDLKLREARITVTNDSDSVMWLIDQTLHAAPLALLRKAAA